MKHFSFLVTILIFFVGCKKNDIGKLASVTTVDATNITSTGFTTGGNINDDGNSGIIQRGIAWATHPQPTVGDSISVNGNGTGNFIVDLTTLNSHTNYYVRAYAINATGTSYGNELSVMTSNGLATITTVAITEIQPLSAKSGGIILNDGGSPITERGIVYGTTSNPTINNFKITNGSGLGIYVSILTPLASQQSYYARAYAINSFGIAYGNQVQFNAASGNTLTDVEGNVYPYVTIGTQNWMASNLKVTKYKNGDPITNGYSITGFNWSTATQGAYSFPNGDPNKKDSFGLLYNRLVIDDARGVCPVGWHIPTDDEWKILEINQGMTQAEADALGYRGTISPKLKEGGASGLNLQLAGYLFHVDGTYLSFGQAGLYYSSTPPNPTSTSRYYRAVFSATDPNALAVNRTFSRYGMSLRCIKD